MKTTMDLPEELLHRAKIVAAQRKTTLNHLVQGGLELVLQSQHDAPERKAAPQRLQEGLRLGGQPLTREESHARH